MSSTSVCYWNVTAVVYNNTQSIFIMISEISNADVYFITNLNSTNSYDSYVRLDKLYTILQFNITDYILIFYRPRSSTTLSYFKFSYWVDIKVANTDSYFNQTVDDNDSIFANVPDILKNYQTYLNGQT